MRCLSSLVALCAALLLAAEWKYASCSGHGDNDTTSPYFLFMKELRQYLSTAEIILPKLHKVRSNTEGSLIATSIETKSSGGKGYSSKGFTFEKDNELELEFTISAESGQDKFPEVELWIFPDRTNVPPDQEKIILYEARATVAVLSRQRKDPGEVVWDTREDCVQINLTQLSNKIYNKFNKSSINESRVNLTIHIQTVHTNLAVHSRDTPSGRIHHKFCSSLIERATNKSFLFIKNYDETGNNITVSRWRRSSQTLTDSNSGDSKGSCHRKTLTVDLIEAYGSFFKGPRDVDIGDCDGGCTTSNKNGLFSHHSIVKERLKMLPDRRELLDYRPRCMPVEFQPLRAHFSLKNKSHVIVQLHDLVVSQCGCR